MAVDGERFPESGGIFRPGALVNLRWALIDSEKATYPIVVMSRQLCVARSTFYTWTEGVENAAWSFGCSGDVAK